MSLADAQADVRQAARRGSLVGMTSAMRPMTNLIHADVLWCRTAATRAAPRPRPGWRGEGRPAGGVTAQGCMRREAVREAIC